MKLVAVLFCLIFPALAAAVTYEEALHLKQEQKLEAAAAAFAQIVQTQPADFKALEQLAVVQGWLQRYDDAIASWRKGQQLAPQNASFFIGEARVQYWKGENPAALTALDQALVREPASIEALTLKGDVLMADQAPTAARAAYEKARELGGGTASPELERKIARAVPVRLWRLDAGATYDHYDGHRGNENSAFTQVGRQVSPELSVYARYDHYYSFSRTDESLTAGAYLLTLRRLLLNAEVGAAIDEAFFRPDALVSITADVLLDGPVQPLLGLRYLDYRNGKVTTITPGLRLRAAAVELELRYGFTDNVDDSRTGVFSARATYAGDDYRPYLSYTSGEEALPPQARADIRIVGAGCVFKLSSDWGLRADYAYEDRKDTYKHQSLGLGLIYRF